MSSLYSRFLRSHLFNGETTIRQARSRRGMGVKKPAKVYPGTRMVTASPLEISEWNKLVNTRQVQRARARTEAT